MEQLKDAIVKPYATMALANKLNGLNRSKNPLLFLGGL